MVEDTPKIVSEIVDLSVIQSGNDQSRSDMAAPVIRTSLLLEEVLRYASGVAIMLLSEMAVGTSHHRHTSSRRMEDRRNRTLPPF